MSDSQMQKVREDFDTIAPFQKEKWDRNSHYNDFLLENLPRNCQHILEIGCGIGTLSRLLAERSKNVTAIDLSPKTIEIAQNLSTSYTNIDFQVADVLEAKFLDEHFDAIVSVATLHHVPLQQVLPKLKSALKTGGKLLVVDLSRIGNVDDFIIGSIAFPLSKILNVFHNGFTKPSKEAREAWANHAKTDYYLTFSEAKQIYQSHFEKAVVERCLFFRYSIIWEK
ncbi:MAG: class I SAM-dependent methyltransferase [Acidobacteriota bacterium]|nr:class I SAM-dependent methyltransferase [Acidobacteriota bacterium]